MIEDILRKRLESLRFFYKNKTIKKKEKLNLALEKNIDIFNNISKNNS